MNKNSGADATRFEESVGDNASVKDRVTIYD